MNASNASGPVSGPTTGPTTGPTSASIGPFNTSKMSRQSSNSDSSTACPSSECETPHNSPVRGVAAAFPGVMAAAEAMSVHRRKSQQPQQQQRVQDLVQRHSSDPIGSSFKIAASSNAAAGISGAAVASGGSNTSTNTATVNTAAAAPNQQPAGGSEAKKSLVSMLCQSLWPMASVCTYRCKFNSQFLVHQATNVRSQHSSLFLS